MTNKIPDDIVKVNIEITHNSALTIPSPVFLLTDQLAFSSDREGAYEIWIADLDLNNPKQITDYGSPFISQEPVFSRDGRYIAFCSNNTGSDQIFIYDLMTGLIEQITNIGVNIAPSFGIDDVLLFTSSRDGVDTLFSFNKGESDLKGDTPFKFTNAATPARRGKYNNKGDKITYGRFNGGDVNVRVIDSDNTNDINVTSGLDDEFNPAWLFDGSGVVYIKEQTTGGGGTAYEIYKIIPANSGGTATRLTTDSIQDQNPATASNEKIYWVKNQDPTFKIWRMNLDGSGQEIVSGGDNDRTVNYGKIQERFL